MTASMVAAKVSKALALNPNECIFELVSLFDFTQLFSSLFSSLEIGSMNLEAGGKERKREETMRDLERKIKSRSNKAERKRKVA